MLDSVSADPRPARAVAGRGLARVVVRHDLAAVRHDWEALLQRAPGSAYQTPAWVAAWLSTLGRAVVPVFGLGLNAAGEPVALLPLGLERRFGLRVARFLGGREVNLGLGLFDPVAALDAADLRRLLDGIATEAGIDLYWLAHQPVVWAGDGNPLLALPNTPSPSFQHEADLAADPDVFLTRTLSKRARKHIRQKEAKLAESGPVRHLTGDTAEQIDRIATALVTQRAVRLGRQAETGPLRAFLTAAARPSTDDVAGVELHALTCGDAVVATFAGALHAGRLSGMLISFAEEPWARFSPGELLLARVAARHCTAGTATLDLGVGEARYKDSFCPRTVPLFETVLGMTWRGRAAAIAWRAALATKRRIKQAPRLSASLARLQRVAARARD